jgi:hypothetical protein
MGAPGATGEDAAMSYPQYQQPNWLGEGQASESLRGSPALAIMSAVVGLGIAGVLAWQTLDLLSLLGEARSIMPAGWTAMIISHFVIAGIVFIGAALVFARLIAGAYILMISAVLTIGAILTAPMVAVGVGASMSDSISYTTLDDKEFYFQQLFGFEFDNGQATFRFAALALGVILLISAVLPPSLNWLRRPRQNDYSAQQADW